MKQNRARLAAALAAALTAGSAAADWKQLESEHFRLTTHHEEAVGRELLLQLEQLRWLGLKLMGADDKALRAQSRFEAFVVRGQHTLRRVFPRLRDGVVGQYTTCREGTMAYGIDDGRAGRDGAPSLGQLVLQHEYAHHLMAQYARIAYPAWYVEGFAEYLSTVSSNGGTLRVGAINPERMSTLSRGGLPWPEVLAWHSRPAAQRSLHDTLGFYAQAWLLTHYMLGDDARTRTLPAYFERVGRGEDPVAAFEAATGIGMAELGERLRRYQAGGMSMLALRGHELPASTIRTTPLGAEADEYLPDDAALRTCVTPEHGQAILARLRALAPDAARASPGLRLALARAESRHGDVQAAITLLQALLESPGEAAEAHYLLGRSWGRRAESLSGEPRDEARQQERSHLLQAYRLRKDHAPTLYHLALALQAGGGSSQNVLNAARAARLFAPAVGDYALLAMQVELQAGDRERAALALGPLASNPHNPVHAMRMRQAMEAIRAGKSLGDVMSVISSSAAGPAAASSVPSAPAAPPAPSASSSPP